MAHEESSELSEPGVGAFDDPAALISPELPAVFIAPVLAALAVRHDEVDAPFGQPFAQRVGIIGTVRDHALWLVARPASGAGDSDLASVASASVTSPGERCPALRLSMLALACGRSSGCMKSRSLRARYSSALNPVTPRTPGET